MAIVNQTIGGAGAFPTSAAEQWLQSQQMTSNMMGAMGAPVTMTPQKLLSMQQLQPLISSLMYGGGTPEMQAQATQKKKTTAGLEGAAGAYTTPQAFADASNAMALELQKSMQTALPAITRGMEGAGTSAGSMQALLAQQAAADAAMRAGAIGADQAKAYGGIQAQLQNTLAQMATTNTDPQMDALLKALSISAAISN